jgi:hypothetical protein
LCEAARRSQVLQNIKKLLPKSDCIAHAVPKWNELSLKNLWAKIRKSTELMEYLPDKWQHCERAWFWAVAFTIKNDWALYVIAEARKAREDNNVVMKRKELRDWISPEWSEALLRHTCPLVSKYFLIAITLFILLESSTHGGINILGLDKLAAKVRSNPKKRFAYSIGTEVDEVLMRMKADEVEEVKVEEPADKKDADMSQE